MILDNDAHESIRYTFKVKLQLYFNTGIKYLSGDISCIDLKMKHLSWDTFCIELDGFKMTQLLGHPY